MWVEPPDESDASHLGHPEPLRSSQSTRLFKGEKSYPLYVASLASTPSLAS